MKYVIDHDLHIHSNLSVCSRDPKQTPGNILRRAKKKGLHTICLTDHFWDEDIPGASQWYSTQNYPHIAAAKPLPQADNIRFLFGCETELNKLLSLGLSKEKYDLFDFIIIPTTHFHMKDFTVSEEDTANAKARANAWVKRLDAVLNMDLPFHKVGIAHLTCSLIQRESREEFLEVLNLIPDADLTRLFSRAAKLGVGIELNSTDMNFADHEAETILRIYRSAKECGCKFYLGSDAHRVASFQKTNQIFARAIQLLDLSEDDKFIIKQL